MLPIGPTFPCGDWEGFCTLEHTCQGKQDRQKCPRKGKWANPSRMFPGVWTSNDVSCNFHIQQKPLQAQLHKVWTEGKFGLKYTLRSTFKVCTKFPVQGFSDGRPSTISFTSKCSCAVGTKGDARTSGLNAIR